MRFCVALLAALLLAASHAQATDGVLEVNQTCAVQTGCFAGDTAGYPITIATAGSYRLTSNLIVPDENTDGIVISAPDVGIDLNNFALIRSGCEGATTDCTPASGTGSGVRYTNTPIRGLSVKRGSITGMGSDGLLLGMQAEVANVRVRWNRRYGIAASFGSTISGNTAYQNGVSGIFASPGSTVSGNTVSYNGNNGIFASNGSTVSDNTAYQNGDDGITTAFGTTVSGNTTYNNGGDGIATSSGSTVYGNTAYANADDGISTSLGATVQRNTVRSNGGYGLRLGSESAYRENVITSNTTGTVTGGVNMFSNSCNGTTTCP